MTLDHVTVGLPISRRSASNSPRQPMACSVSVNGPISGNSPDYSPSPADVVGLFEDAPVQTTGYPAMQAFAAGRHRTMPCGRSGLRFCHRKDRSTATPKDCRQRGFHDVLGAESMPRRVSRSGTHPSLSNSRTMRNTSCDPNGGGTSNHDVQLTRTIHCD